MSWDLNRKMEGGNIELVYLPLKLCAILYFSPVDLQAMSATFSEEGPYPFWANILAEQLPQITHYLAELFCQMTCHLVELFHKIGRYFAEHLIQTDHNVQLQARRGVDFTFAK